MKRILSVGVAVLCLSVSSASARSMRSPLYGVEAGIFPPAQIFGMEYEVYGLDLGLVASRSLSVRGLQLAPIFNMVDDEMFGVQLAGGVNYIEDEGAGLMLSGLGNMARGPFKGVQIGAVNEAPDMCGGQIGLVNWTTSPTYLQVGALNLAENLQGLGVGVFANYDTIYGLGSSVVNLTKGDVYGWQDGAVSFAKKVYGVQDGAAVAYASEGVIGLQMACVGISDGASWGAQIGVVNVSEEQHGVQIGVVNVASQMRGVQIGVVNVITDGPLPFMIGMNMAF